MSFRQGSVQPRDSTRQQLSPIESTTNTAETAVSTAALLCFADGEGANPSNLRLLMEEAQNDLDEKSANEWAAGYVFNPAYAEIDIRCLCAAQLDFVTMVRRRLKTLSGNRLSKERVNGLRADNPDRTLKFDLAEGMRVSLPGGITPNDLVARTPL